MELRFDAEAAWLAPESGADPWRPVRCTHMDGSMGGSQWSGAVIGNPWDCCRWRPSALPGAWMPWLGVTLVAGFHFTLPHALPQECGCAVLSLFLLSMMVFLCVIFCPCVSFFWWLALISLCQAPYPKNWLCPTPIDSYPRNSALQVIHIPISGTQEVLDFGFGGQLELCHHSTSVVGPAHYSSVRRLQWDPGAAQGWITWRKMAGWKPWTLEMGDSPITKLPFLWDFPC